MHKFLAFLLFPACVYSTTPWPLPINLTQAGGAISTASISPTFTFSCDPKCSSTCATSSIVASAFSRFSARLRPVTLSPPAALRISSTSSWWRIPGADCDGHQFDLGVSCDGTNVSACESKCEALPACGGFNTHGVLKNKQCGPQGSILPGAGCGGCVDLYLLKDAPEPPPGTLTGVEVCIGSPDETLGQSTDESYSLVAPNDGVGRIEAPTVFGALHAMESLVQLLDLFGVDPATRRISFAPVYITDAPRFAYRGLLIDTSRHFIPISQILHTIDALAYNKLNVLHWHIVDSISFPCGSDTYPAFAQHAAYDPTAIYSPAQMRAVVAYGLERGVRILPEWDLPGHGDWSGVEGMMGCSDVVDPTSDTLYSVLSGFLGEMGGIFTEQMMFLGGDEVNSGCWDNNPNITAWLKAHNMTSSQLQQYFWVTMAQRVLPALNKTIGVWEADSLQIDLSSLPAGAFTNVYQSFSTAKKTTGDGKPSVVSIAGDWWYLDQNTCGSYHQDGWACTYDQTLDDPTWTPLQKTFLWGGETAMWGEGINKDNQDAYIWRGASAAAERLWSPLSITPNHTLATGRFTEQLCRLHELGVHAGPIGPGFCPADTQSLPMRGSAAAHALRMETIAAANSNNPLTLTVQQVKDLAALLQ